jgi:hypothetical protein
MAGGVEVVEIGIPPAEEAGAALIGEALIGLIGIVFVLAVTPIADTPVRPSEAECKQIKDDCIAECARELPTPDHGFKFWNCVNDCMRREGC